MKYPSSRLVILLALALGCAGFSGCVIGSTHTTTSTGREISPTTFAQIGPGKTKDNVVALIGEPSEKLPEDNGSEIWKWHYSERHETNTELIFVLSSHNDNKIDKTNYVEFKGGIVTRAWSE